jgi:Fe-S cluster biosynthesis and repair protein YggX
VDACIRSTVSFTFLSPHSGSLEIPASMKYLGTARFRNLREDQMADDKCADNMAPSPSPQAASGNVRMVMCVKFGRELPGLDRIPWKGEIGKRVFDNVSKDAWKLWIEHSKMIMNEYRLNPLDPNSQKIMEEQLEQFFFGEGAKLPEGYVPQRAKG